jgi:hypothetical protein
MWISVDMLIRDYVADRNTESTFIMWYAIRSVYWELDALCIYKPDITIIK